MSELEMPTVITAISSSEAESFVAGTLFAQGWSVVFRAIDWDSLDHYITVNSEIAKGALLLYASDLPGISAEKANSLSNRTRQSIGFKAVNGQVSELNNLQELPIVATDLVSLVRGFVRAPMLRAQSNTFRQHRKSKVIAIGSAGSYTGCTVIAMNLAMELSVLEKSTLLIEANFRAPSIAAYLAMRNIKGEGAWKLIAPNLSVAEIDQEHAHEIEEVMARATSEFDYIIIDLGSISGLSNRLTDRRWTSTMTTWCCDHADELMITSRADQLGHHRLNQVIELLQQTSIRAKLSFLFNMKFAGKRGENAEAKFTASVTQLKPIRVRSIANDPRAITAAIEEHATLIEINERSNMRKSIAELARELKS
jgi:MinD-like ATPase involved in chromosome partitioning or flagellar assembly